MGVLACDRAECPNIMCDHLIAGRFYCCFECWSELHGALKVSLVKAKRAKVLKFVEKFMAKPRTPPEDDDAERQAAKGLLLNQMTEYRDGLEWRAHKT